MKSTAIADRPERERIQYMERKSGGGCFAVIGKLACVAFLAYIAYEHGRAQVYTEAVNRGYASKSERVVIRDVLTLYNYHWVNDGEKTESRQTNEAR